MASTIYDLDGNNGANFIFASQQIQAEQIGLAYICYAKKKTLFRQVSRPVESNSVCNHTEIRFLSRFT